MERIQDSQPKDAIDAKLFVEVHLEMPDEECWQAQDCDVDYNVRDAADDVHDGVIGRSHTYYPIAPEWPDLEERCEQK